MDISLADFDRPIALIGFVITIWQLYKTKGAAIAAKAAADETAVAIRNFEAVTKLFDISSRTRDLTRLLRDGSIVAAAAAAFELRDALARHRDSNHLVDTAAPDWQKAVLDVHALHDRLEGLAMFGRTRKEDREPLVLEVARLHTFFTRLAAQA